MALVKDIRTMEIRCTDCPEKDDKIRSHELVLNQMGVEIDHLKAAHAQTLARKSNVMRDWLNDQTRLWKLRCQIRELGHDPIE